MDITLEKIETAKKLLAGNIVKTPEILSNFLSDVIQGSAYLKLENLQYTSSFKACGATHAEEIVYALRHRGFSFALMDKPST